MIVGAHSVIYSTNTEADRAFFRDVLKLPHVNVGDGWLIFGLPPSEAAFHPSDKNDRHELYLMCADVERFVSDMNACNVACAPVQNQGWGLLTQITLPGGGKLGVYQPRHARPKSAAPAGARNVRATRKRKPAAKRIAKKAAKTGARGPAKRR